MFNKAPDATLIKEPDQMSLKDHDTATRSNPAPQSINDSNSGINNDETSPRDYISEDAMHLSQIMSLPDHQMYRSQKIIALTYRGYSKKEIKRLLRPKPPVDMKEVMANVRERCIKEQRMLRREASKNRQN